MNYPFRRGLASARFALRSSVWRNYQYLKEGMLLDRASVEREQADLRERIVSYAAKNCLFYREVLAPSNYRGLDDWEKIPFLTKNILRTRFSDLQSTDSNVTNVIRNTSGGSTGEPVVFLQDQNYKNWEAAGKMLYDSLGGYQPGMPKVVLWGSERDLLHGKGLRGRIGSFLLNLHLINAFLLSENQMHQAVKTINRVRPVQILAYSESLFSLAGFIDRGGFNVFSPRMVMVSAGTLSAFMREKIERVFRAPVFNRYGSREAGDMACSFGAEELFVNPRTHYVEIIRPDGSLAKPGEEGEIVVTVFRSHAMPLIRYRIGDVGAWSTECASSVPLLWPRLSRVSGRVSDIFVNRSGDRVHGEYFTHLMYNQEWVKTFQVIQETETEILVKIVPVGNLSQRSQNAFESVFAESARIVMGAETDIRFEYVETICPTRSGKHRYTVSRCCRD